MSGLGGVAPKAGVRISLKQQSCGEEEAVYGVTVSAGDHVTEGQATVSQKQEPQLAFAEELPEKVRQLVTSLLRTSCRGKDSKEWPHRLTRWRELP